MRITIDIDQGQVQVASDQRTAESQNAGGPPAELLAALGATLGEVAPSAGAAESAGEPPAELLAALAAEGSQTAAASRSGAIDAGGPPADLLADTAANGVRPN